MRALQNVCRRTVCVSLCSLAIVIALGVGMTPLSRAQIQGRATGWCTDHNGRNFRCGTRSAPSRGNNRAATRHNNRCADLLRAGQRRKSLDLVARAIAECRRAMALQSHWIHQRNLFAALAYYWSLRASREHDCSRKLVYMRRAFNTSHYYPAHHRRNYRSQIAAVQRGCRGGGGSAGGGGKAGGGSSGGTSSAGVVQSVTGNVRICDHHRCWKLIRRKSVEGTIKTSAGSRAQIAMPDGSTMAIGPNSEISFSLRNRAEQIVTLVHGVFRSFRAHARHYSKSIRYKTTPGTASTRGTEFVMRWSRRTRTLTVDLLDGELLFAPRLGGRSLLMKPGLWAFSMFGARGSGSFRVRWVRAYRGASDRALAGRRAHYNRVLPIR